MEITLFYGIVLLEYACRAAEKEIAALSHMAEQLNPRLATEPASEAVDLDNLFAFLSDVQPGSRNQIIEEIGEKMDELVEDLDVEVYYKIYLFQRVIFSSTNG